jgi:hypothetical protein
MAAALTGLFATSPSAYAEDRGGDESKTSTDQSVKQKNTGSGDSANFNCGGKPNQSWCRRSRVWIRRLDRQVID